MVANAGQTGAVLMIVAGAAGYLLLLARRAWKSGHGGACSGCHALPKRTAETDPQNPQSIQQAAVAAQAPPKRMFIPLENLADAARRHREQLDSSRPEDSV